MGNKIRRDSRYPVVVKGIEDITYRTSNGRKKKTCDSCLKEIKKDSEYIRVLYYDKSKEMEMFHHGCFLYEFTDKPGGPPVLPE